MKGFRHSARSRLVRAASLCALGAALVAAGPSSLAVAADPTPAPTAAPVPPPLPKITKLEPAVVTTLGDDFVSIIGEQLQSVTGVTVDGVPVEFFDEGDGSLSFYTPPHARGVVQVRVTGPAGTSIDNGAADDLLYAAGEGPRLDSISPTSGPASGGATLAIRGQFDGATGVYFYPEGQAGGVPASGDIQLVSSSEIRVEAPALAPGRYLVDVVSPWGPSFGGQLYYTAVAAPTITKLSERFVASFGGDSVLISGEHLESATSVTVGGLPVEWFDEGDGTLSFFTPPRANAAVVQVRVTGPGGTSADNGVVDDLEYWNGERPTLRSISPTSGPVAGGTTITLRGELPRSLAVIFTLGDANFVVGEDAIEVISNGEIRVKAPAMPAGRYQVGVINPSSISDSAVPLYYTAVAAPQLLQVSPAWGIAGVGGLTVISGKNFAGTKSVRFGNKLALRFLVMGNRILAMAPPQPRGVYPVTVTTAGGTSAQTMAGRYIYVNLGAG